MAKRQEKKLPTAVKVLCRERLGLQKTLAAETGYGISYVSRLLKGTKLYTPGQFNRLLDACNATDEERRRLNEWGAREAGWRL
jgi:hypothetical protein